MAKFLIFFCFFSATFKFVGGEEEGMEALKKRLPFGHILCGHCGQTLSVLHTSTAIDKKMAVRL